MAQRRTVQVFGADEQDDVELDVLRWIRLAQLVLEEERVAPDAEMSVIFVGEQTMSDLNQRFLDGSGPTDVLAFPLEDEVPLGGRQPDEGGRGPGSPADAAEPPVVLGDVVVCPRVAQRQADERGEPLDAEIALLVVHGSLHLLGYDHAEPEQTVAMQQRERELLARFREVEASAGESTA